MRISFKDKESLIREWNSIGENDCNPPSRYLDDLFLQILDSISEKEIIECHCETWSDLVEDFVEPNPNCRKCQGTGWYYGN